MATAAAIADVYDAANVKTPVSAGAAPAKKNRKTPLVLATNPPVDPNFKPKWPVLVLSEYGDFTGIEFRDLAA